MEGVFNDGPILFLAEDDTDFMRAGFYFPRIQFIRRLNRSRGEHVSFGSACLALKADNAFGKD